MARNQDETGMHPTLVKECAQERTTAVRSPVSPVIKTATLTKKTRSCWSRPCCRAEGSAAGQRLLGKQATQNYHTAGILAQPWSAPGWERILSAVQEPTEMAGIVAYHGKSIPLQNIGSWHWLSAGLACSRWSTGSQPTGCLAGHCKMALNVHRSRPLKKIAVVPAASPIAPPPTTK